MTVADRDGLAALSMRRLGAELGVEAMTLYHHVASKDALLDGLVEQIFTEATPPFVNSPSWQTGLRRYARSLRTTLMAHPNVLPLVVSRPAITPQNLQIMESALAQLHAAGFTLRQALDVVYTLTGFVVGHVATFAEGPAEELLSEIDAADYPLLARAVRQGRNRTANAHFSFAVDALLRGFQDVLDASARRGHG